MDTTPEPCAAIRARRKFDKTRGHTTSQHAEDFIRRTCACDACKAWRRIRVAARQMPSASAP